MTTLRFHAVDSWFFRNARPYDVLGGVVLDGRFPPGIRTVAGAVRTLLGDHWGADWAAFARDRDTYEVDGERLRDRIGWGPDPGRLRFGGPWLVAAGERLYPVPRFLFQRPVRQRGDETNVRWLRPHLGAPVESDRGRVRFPALPPGSAGARPAEKVWLTAVGMARVLAGGVPHPEEMRTAAVLWTRERHLGIARIPGQRTAQPGLLYAADHVRPIDGVGLELDVAGGPDVWPLPAWVRLGGDGRAAFVEAVSEPAWPAPPACGSGRGLVLVLATPGLWEGDPAVLPGFQPEAQEGVRTWTGRLCGVRLRLHAAAMAFPFREGGWDLARGRPVARQAYIPAGSSWYVTLSDDEPLVEVIRRLHGHAVGMETEWGRGRLLAGCWPAGEGCPAD